MASLFFVLCRHARGVGFLAMLTVISATVVACGQPAPAAIPPASLLEDPVALVAATSMSSLTDPATATATPAAADTPTASPTATATTTPTPTDTPAPTATPTVLPTPDGVTREARVPILMYHYLSDPPPGADRYRRDLSVSPALFEQHLAWLREQGYQSITLEQLLRHLVLGEPLPERPIIITFDDGYADNYANAFPLLAKYGFGGTFFVVTELAERASAGMTAPDGTVYADDYMTWAQMQEMQAAGMDIQCHARVHEDLTDMDDERLIWQVLGCREMIESNLGQRPRFVAYPSGIYDQRVAGFFASDDFYGGITTRQGSRAALRRPLRTPAAAHPQHDHHRRTGRAVGVGRGGWGVGAVAATCNSPSAL